MTKRLNQQAILLSLMFVLGLAPVTLSAETLVDLTHPFNDKTIYWPTAHGFQLEKRGWKTTDKGYFYAANIIKLPEHGGTHLDAPIHFAQNKWTVDEIPLAHLKARLAVIDLRAQVKKQADYLISAEDIQNWEKTYGPLGKQHVVIFNTGWARFWPNKKKYLGTDKFGDTHNLHFPGLSKQAATYLVMRKIKGVGLDTASLDYGQSKDFWAHRVLAKANIYGLENLTNLNQLPATGAHVIVAPMKIEGGTGGPTRVLVLKK